MECRFGGLSEEDATKAILLVDADDDKNAVCKYCIYLHSMLSMQSVTAARWCWWGRCRNDNLEVEWKEKQQ
jgi:hypothetical protein